VIFMACISREFSSLSKSIFVLSDVNHISTLLMSEITLGAVT
jgi:hypothetical protein